LGNPQVFEEKLSGVLIEREKQRALTQCLREFPQAPALGWRQWREWRTKMPPIGGTLIAGC
jgi:hypothetical protein